MSGRPFEGEIPADWTVHNAETGGVLFEGKKGTEAYNVTVQLDLLEKDSLPVKSLNELTESVRDLLRQKPDAAVAEATRHKTPEGRDARMIQARYTFKNGRGTALPYRRLNVLVDYPGYFVSFAYYGADSLFEKYMDRFELIGQRFRYTGSQAAAEVDRKAGSGR